MTIARVIVLFFSDINLGPDETQYWFWSQTPAFGYFSKPPMIAWVIGMVTLIFGDSEWAVRLAAPLLHMGTASLIFLTARSLYTDRVALWAGIVWLTLPGVSLSSMVISTDALLLFFWSAALFLFFKLINHEGSENQSIVTPALLGAAIGFGFLSKYAMVYFLISLVLVYVFSKKTLGGKTALIASIVALAIVAPNIYWNFNHGFQTITHTAANANWQQGLVHPIQLIEFLLAQFGVFGPLTFALLIFGFVKLRSRLQSYENLQFHNNDLQLICFILPPLLIISAQAFLSRAHANWAAVAFPAASILITAWAFRASNGRILKSAVAINAIGAILFTTVILNFSIADSLRLSGVIKRVRGWEAQIAEIENLSPNYDAVMADDRELMGAIVYYGRSNVSRAVALNSNFKIDHHYEAFHPFDPDADKTVLFITANGNAIEVRDRFKSVRRIGETTADLKKGQYRRLYMFEISGYKPLTGNLLEKPEVF